MSLALDRDGNVYGWGTMPDDTQIMQPTMVFQYALSVQCGSLDSFILSMSHTVFRLGFAEPF